MKEEKGKEEKGGGGSTSLLTSRRWASRKKLKEGKRGKRVREKKRKRAGVRPLFPIFSPPPPKKKGKEKKQKREKKKRGSHQGLTCGFPPSLAARPEEGNSRTCARGGKKGKRRRAVGKVTIHFQLIEGGGEKARGPRRKGEGKEEVVALSLMLSVHSIERGERKTAGRTAKKEKKGKEVLFNIRPWD